MTHRPGRTGGARRIAAAILALVCIVPPGGGAGAAPPDREAWRKVESGNVTVVGTASDTRLVETATALRVLVGLLPGLVPEAFGPPPPLVAAVVHDVSHLDLVGRPASAPEGERVVLVATSDEEARADLLRSAVLGVTSRARRPLPPWLSAGLAEYLSTFALAGGRATLGRAVPEHVALLASSSRARPAAPPALQSPAAGALWRAEAWAVVHLLLNGLPDGEERLGRFVRLLAEGRRAESAFADAFGEPERSLLARARARAVEARPLARFVALPAASPTEAAGGPRVLPLTRAGAAALLGGVARGRRTPSAGAPEDEALPRGPAPDPLPSRAVSRPSAPPDVPAEVDLVNRLIDAGREEEALARLEALHASLGHDREMQRALGWDVAEVRRVVAHNRLVRRYNQAVGLLNAGRREEALAMFREVAEAAEDPGLGRLARERATSPGR